jgi:hypothetical protein
MAEDVIMRSNIYYQEYQRRINQVRESSDFWIDTSIAQSYGVGKLIISLQNT